MKAIATEKESVFSRQQTTLDRVAIASLKDRVGRVEEKLEKIELNLETLKTGQAIMSDAMVRAGILTSNGEPATERIAGGSSKADAASRKVDVEKLVGELKVQEKTSTKSKLPYYIAKAEDNKNEAFKVLQEKLRAHRGFWSKRVGNSLFKFWFSYEDETKICWRKV